MSIPYGKEFCETPFPARCGKEIGVNELINAPRGQELGNELARQDVAALARHLQQGLDDLAEAIRETEPGTIAREQRLRSAVAWGLRASEREVMMLALEAATARVRDAQSQPTRTG